MSKLVKLAETISTTAKGIYKDHISSTFEGITINTVQKLDSLFSFLLSKKTAKINKIDLIKKDNGLTSITTRVSMQYSRVGKYCLVDENGFSETFISIAMNQNSSGGSVVDAETILASTVLLLNGRITLVNPNGTRESYSGKEISEAEELLDDCRWYRSFAGTASDARQFKDLFMLVQVGEEEKDLRYFVLNEAAHGALEYYYELYKKGIINKEMLLKVRTYLGNVITGSTPICPANNYIRVHKKWMNNAQEYRLSSFYKDLVAEANTAVATNDFDDAFSESSSTKLVDEVDRLAMLPRGKRDFSIALKARLRVERDRLIKEDVTLSDKLKTVNGTFEFLLFTGLSSTQDGQGYTNSPVLSRETNAFLGINTTPEAFVGNLLQGRPYSTKASYKGKTLLDYIAIVKGSIKMVGLKNITIVINNVPHNGAEFSEEKFLELAKNTLFIGDDNVFKLEYDMTSKGYFEVLAIAKTSMGHTSKQLIESHIDGLLENDAIQGLSVFANELEKAALLPLTELSNKEFRSISQDEINSACESGYNLDIFRKVCPDVVLSSRNLLAPVVKQEVNAGVKVLDKCCIDIESNNMRLCSDDTFIITGAVVTGLLQEGEVFINNPAIEEVIVIKYPKMGAKERYVARNVPTKEIVCRLNMFEKAGVIDSEMKLRIASSFKNTDKKLIILPALALIMHMCAGLDYDYDGGLILLRTKDTGTNSFSNILFESLKSTQTAVVIDN